VPPQLTEVWASAYFQVLAALLVFAFGIPALAVQLAVPEDIRLVLYRHTSARRLYFLGMIVLALLLCGVALFFVWSLHPCVGGSCELWKEWLGGTLVTVAFVAAVLSWWFTVLVLSRQLFVAMIRDKVTKALSSSDGGDGSELVEDFVGLGERSERGFQKDLLIKAVGCIARNVQGSPGYTGSEMCPLLRRFPRVLVSAGSAGSEDNYNLGVRVLRDALARSRHPQFAPLDSMVAHEALAELARGAVRNGFSLAVDSAIEAVAQHPPTVLAIGSVALEAGEFPAALSALDFLQRVTDAKRADQEELVYLMGMVACFWVRGDQLKRRAEATLAGLSEHSWFVPAVALRYALDFFYDCGQYRIAGAVQRMFDDLCLPDDPPPVGGPLFSLSRPA